MVEPSLDLRLRKERTVRSIRMRNNALFFPLNSYWSEPRFRAGEVKMQLGLGPYLTQALPTPFCSPAFFRSLFPETLHILFLPSFTPSSITIYAPSSPPPHTVISPALGMYVLLSLLGTTVMNAHVPSPAPSLPPALLLLHT